LETGSVNADYSPHRDNHGETAFQESLASIAELVAEAEKFGVHVGIEAVTSHVVSTPAKMRRMLDAVASNNLQVVFDPVNLLTADSRQERVFEEAFDLWGDRIVAVHAKDFVVEAGTLKFTRLGRGQLNHRLALGEAVRRKPGVSVLLEETNEQTVAECVKFIKDNYS